jgi:undecaprenyl-diphosphatase
MLLLRRFRDLLDFVSGRGWLPIALATIAAVALWGFFEVADTIGGREANAFDRDVFVAIAGLYDRVPEFWQEVGRDITGLGGTATITLLVSAVVGFLCIGERWRAALFVVVSVLGGLAISLILKELYERPRPDMFEHRSHVHTPSFPSGHSTNSAIAYFTMAVLLAKLVDRPLLKGYIFFVGLLVPVLVGISRVFVGVHWPTDVIAGWTIGLAWGLLVWAAATWLQRSGRMEQDTAVDRPDRGRVAA